MVKTMAKVKIIAPFFGILIAFYAILGFVITFCRYAADKPVATVQIIKICQKEGGESYFGGYFPGEYFANVQIQDIKDEASFKETAQKISRDGQRANLDFSKNPEIGKSYSCYGKHSLRGCGIVGKWDNFADHWRETSLLCFSISVLICFIGLVIFAARSEKKSVRI